MQRGQADVARIGHSGAIRRQSALRLMAASAGLALSGCACSDDEWNAMVAFPAAVQSLAIAAGCEFGNLAHLSETSAALVGRADPQMLELARHDAERDCHRAAARLARERQDEASLMSGPLK